MNGWAARRAGVSGSGRLRAHLEGRKVREALDGEQPAAAHVGGGVLALEAEVLPPPPAPHVRLVARHGELQISLRSRSCASSVSGSKAVRRSPWSRRSSS